MKIIIYTCITKNYDNLKTPLTIDERFEYICFTDNSSKITPPWLFYPIPSSLNNLSSKDQNRYIKMHPHEFFPEYDASVYIDGSILIVGDLYPWIYSILDLPEDIFIYKHPERNCIFDEAAACAHYSHDWIWTIASQMRQYSMFKYPLDNGLYEANVLIRRNTILMKKLMGKWWSEYSNGARRDQLSLPFVAWQLNIPLGSLGESDPRFSNKLFKFINHPIRRNIKVIIRKYVNRTIAALFSYEKLFRINCSLKWQL